MFWAAAGGQIGAGLVSAIGGILSGKGKKKQAQAEAAFKAKEERALAQDQAKYGAIETLFQSNLQDFERQRERQRKERGLDQFRNFSTMGKWAPGMESTNRIQVPTQPGLESFIGMIGQADMSKPNKL